MTEPLGVPVLSSSDIGRIAEEFLRKRHPDGTIPIPIEEIAEFQMGLDIVPVPGLHNLVEVDGFLGSDLSTLYVEEYVFESVPNRYRFTIAHEVGHAVMHGEVYRRAAFDDIDGWRSFINSMTDNDHRWLEWQAYEFAGLVLVPPAALNERVAAAVDRVRAEGIALEENRDFAWTVIAASLAKEFCVSTQVVSKRLEKDKIPEQYR